MSSRKETGGQIQQPRNRRTEQTKGGRRWLFAIGTRPKLWSMQCGSRFVWSYLTRSVGRWVAGPLGPRRAAPRPPRRPPPPRALQDKNTPAASPSSSSSSSSSLSTSSSSSVRRGRRCRLTSTFGYLFIWDFCMGSPTRLARSNILLSISVLIENNCVRSVVVSLFLCETPQCRCYSECVEMGQLELCFH